MNEGARLVEGNNIYIGHYNWLAFANNGVLKSEGGVFVNKTKFRVVRSLDLDGLPALFLKGV